MRLGNTRCKASLVMFFALAFAWSWVCWLLAPALNGEYPFAADALSLTGGFGPSLAAMVMVAHRSGRAGLRRWMTRCLGGRVGRRWILLAFVFPAFFMGLAAAAHGASGGTLPPPPGAAHVWMAAPNF